MADGRYFGNRRRSGTGLVRRQTPTHDIVVIEHDGDWGDLNEATVRTAAAILVDAIGHPDAAMFAEEFAADCLRTLDRHGFILPADQVRAWYRAETAEMAEDARADFKVDYPQGATE